MRHPLIDVHTLLSAAEAAELLDTLYTEILWNDGAFVAAGRRFQLPRLQAWFSDRGIDYRYAANLLNSHPWTPVLDGLRQRVEEITGARFNAVLANLYRDGRDSVGWHADDEDDLGPAPLIASLSLGAVRQFHWRPKPGQPGASGHLALAPGTLLLMRPPFQQHWEHAVPADAGVGDMRLNLTFRLVHPVSH
ncbi:alpha-ketoglutarate-dependent dioxygenase AlkB [Azoarcus sp. L1K30]|uniref:alpha-ketoglutarate-dependent dioxygenase AlkB family protein n=1 Tax=Azoarcus sp. L1K30 TaxID=2820277 RepID=UPI001B824BBF|nr:alpha-ketoglutarate-dependent dioxygenase AlkB [Azoarcus sp. L1K30]